MRDRSKCSGENCVLKNSCGRTTSYIVSEYESFFLKPPFKINKGLFQCAFFIGDPAELLLTQMKSLFRKGK